MEALDIGRTEGRRQLVRTRDRTLSLMPRFILEGGIFSVPEISICFISRFVSESKVTE